ncbi:hypothetical protein CYMTET_3260 [Cymbomonas tetramitiformis]|uniref:NrS-1 polymerase-like helicase domain-containing protein n=1 Tax=Cymbomonas tetramitiformis TaxID=36881 RepID=A0AAE0H3J0_9CHLO|nr:hypothetical protein CYMTET_3260 [Cymbomonas tetramitiformis]
MTFPVCARKVAEFVSAMVDLRSAQPDFVVSNARQLSETSKKDRSKRVEEWEIIPNTRSTLPHRGAFNGTRTSNATAFARKDVFRDTHALRTRAFWKAQRANLCTESTLFLYKVFVAILQKNGVTIDGKSVANFGIAAARPSTDKPATMADAPTDAPIANAPTDDDDDDARNDHLSTVVVELDDLRDEAEECVFSSWKVIDNVNKTDLHKFTATFDLDTATEPLIDFDRIPLFTLWKSDARYRHLVYGGRDASNALNSRSRTAASAPTPPGNNQNMSALRATHPKLAELLEAEFDGNAMWKESLPNGSFKSVELPSQDFPTRLLMNTNEHECGWRGVLTTLPPDKDLGPTHRKNTAYFLLTEYHIQKSSDDDDHGRIRGVSYIDEAIELLVRLLGCNEGRSRDLWMREHEKVIHSLARVGSYDKKLIRYAKELFSGTEYMDRCWPNPLTNPPCRGSGIKFLRDLVNICEAERSRTYSTDSHHFIAAADDGTDEEVTSRCGHTLYFHSQQKEDGGDSGPYKLTIAETERGTIKRKRDDAPEQLEKLIRFTAANKVCNASGSRLEYDVHADGKFVAKCKDPTCRQCPVDLKGFKKGAVNFFQLNLVQNNNITINMLPHSRNSRMPKPDDYLPTDLEFIDNGKLSQYNSRYAVAKYGSSMIVIAMQNGEGSEEERQQNFNYWQSAAFHTHMALDQKIDGSTKIFWSKVWMNHPKRRTYNGITFEPRVDTVPNNYFNLWQGFAVKPSPSPTPEGELGVQKYLQLVKEGSCSGDDVCYTYMLNWMAHAVQKPWEKPGVAIILYGGQGDGKGMVIREFGKIFGKHFKQVAHSRHFTGHFNALLSDCILLFVDEAVNNARDANIVKNQITEEWTVLEKKGQDSLAVLSRLHIMMATNTMWPLDNKERRVHLMKVTPIFNRDYVFFSELSQQMDQGGRDYLMHILQTRDISDFLPMNMPEDATSVKPIRLEAKMANFSLIQEWCYTNLCEAAYPFSADEPLETVTVYETFKLQMKHRGEQTVSEISRIGFTKKLKEIFAGSLTVKTGQNNRRLLVFAGLDDCKTDFAKHLRMSPEEMEWDGV